MAFSCRLFPFLQPEALTTHGLVHSSKSHAQTSFIIINKSHTDLLYYHYVELGGNDCALIIHELPYSVQ